LASAESSCVALSRHKFQRGNKGFRRPHFTLRYEISGQALLLARIYEVFPLHCTICGGEIRIIAFITDAANRLSRSEIVRAEGEASHRLHKVV